MSEWPGRMPCPQPLCADTLVPGGKGDRPGLVFIWRAPDRAAASQCAGPSVVMGLPGLEDMEMGVDSSGDPGPSPRLSIRKDLPTLG